MKTIEIDVEDDATEEEIDMAKMEAAQDWANNYIEISF